MVDESKKNSKRGRDNASKGNLWGFDPDALCIIGGKLMANKDEIGPLDTDDGEEHDLYDPRLYLAAAAITEEEIKHADEFGIDGAALVAKMDGVDVLVDGRRKGRVARLVNKRRRKRGVDPLVLDCKIVRGTGADLMGKMISSNELRVDDDLPTKIFKAKRLLNKGVSADRVALRFGVERPVFDGWLRFDDNAISATKRALEMGRVSFTTAARIAVVKEPDEQKKALDEVLATAATMGGKASGRAARVIAGKHGSGGIVGITDKKTQRRLISYIEETPERSNTSDETIAMRRGMILALKAVVGDEIGDSWLTKKIDEVYALMKTEARAKRLEKVQKQAKKSKKTKKAKADEKAADEEKATADEAGAEA